MMSGQWSSAKKKKHIILALAHYSSIPQVGGERQSADLLKVLTDIITEEWPWAQWV